MLTTVNLPKVGDLIVRWSSRLGRVVNVCPKTYRVVTIEIDATGELEEFFNGLWPKEQCRLVTPEALAKLKEIASIEQTYLAKERELHEECKGYVKPLEAELQAIFERGD